MYEFKNAELYRQALTHKSFHNENPTESRGHNERFEFLGDAVLDLALSSDLMLRFPELTEGELSKIRASLVNENTLSDVAKELSLDTQILLGKGEHLTGGATKPRLLASAFEALVGAVFLDGNFDSAHAWLQQVFQTRFQELDLSVHYKSDYKTRLQEKIQGLYRQTPQYVLEKEEGPDHDKVFFVTVKLEGRVLSQGMGRSKKQAEQDAARVALEGEKI